MANNTIRIGFVGAGRRVREMYLPVLDVLASGFTLAGFVSKSGERARVLASERAVDAYRDVQQLAEVGRADMIVVAVGAAANADVAKAAMATGRAVLMETPIALTPAEGRTVVRSAARASAPVGIAEQKPFLAWECFKRELVAQGAIGDVLIVDNDFRSLEYHAIAQLRRQLPSSARPISAQATRLKTALATGPRSQRGPAPEELWVVGSVAFDDGSLLTYRSSSAYARTPIRTFRSLRIYGSRGSIVNEDVVVLDGTGQAVSLVIQRTPGASAEVPRRIVCTLPDGAEVAWDHPWPAAVLTDDQMAIAQHVAAMGAAIRNEGAVLYGPHEALLDVELMDAMSQSATKGGVPVPVSHRCADPQCRPLPRSTSVRRRLDAAGRRLAGSDLGRGLATRARALRSRSR